MKATSYSGLSTDELKSDFIEITRNAVLDALDKTVKNGKGWKDSDLAELFPVIDKIAGRNFDERQKDMNPDLGHDITRS